MITDRDAAMRYTLGALIESLKHCQSLDEYPGDNWSVGNELLDNMSMSILTYSRWATGFRHGKVAPR